MSLVTRKPNNNVNQHPPPPIPLDGDSATLMAIYDFL